MRCCRHWNTWQCGKSLGIPELLVSLSPIHTLRGLGQYSESPAAKVRRYGWPQIGMEWPMSQSVGLGGEMAFNQDSPILILLGVASWAKDVLLGSLMNAAPTVTP